MCGKQKKAIKTKHTDLMKYCAYTESCMIYVTKLTILCLFISGTI